MKYWFIISLILFSVKIGKGAEDHPLNNAYINIQGSIETLPPNYQQFKHQLLRLNFKQDNTSVSKFGNKKNYTILYTAGGILLATSSLVIFNSLNSDQDIITRSDTGVLIGGVFSTSVFIVKFFIDNRGK